jgi:hypothetical protein
MWADFFKGSWERTSQFEKWVKVKTSIDSGGLISYRSSGGRRLDLEVGRFARRDEGASPEKTG